VNSIVAFDLGKVLLDFDYSIAARKLAAHCPMSLPEIRTLIEQSQFVIDYETGRLSRQEFYRRVRQLTGFSGNLEEFGEFFADIFTEMPAMTALQAELRQRGFPTYIFSNTNDLAIEHVRRSFPFFANFDGYIFSYEVGTMKPDPLIYEALEKLSGRRGADIVYLDDRPENVAGGAARGWRAILHESPEKTRDALEQFKIV